MAIINSLRSSSTILTRTGQIEVQSTKKPQDPITFSSSIIFKQAKPSQNNAGVLTPERFKGIEALPIKDLNVVELANRVLSGIKDISVEELIDRAADSSRISFPSNNIFNHVQAAYRPLRDRDNSNNNAIVPNRKLEPYEKLTGISHDRPEIILLSTFQPVFLSENSTRQNFSGMTDVGKFIDSQIYAQKLLMLSSRRNLRNMSNDPKLSEKLKLRTSNFAKTLNELEAITQFLLTLIQKIDQAKLNLDLRSDLYQIDAIKAIKTLNSTFKGTDVSETLQKYAGNFLVKKYNIIDVLEQLGYDRSSSLNIFTSTKLWLQACYELKNSLKYHTSTFLRVEKKNKLKDKSSTQLFKEKIIPAFKIKTIDFEGVLSVSDCAKQTVPEISGLIKNFERAFNLFYEKNSFFDNEESKIAALTNFLIKEYSYSQALSNDNTVNLLRDKFQYNVSTTNNNLQVFDSVVGTFPDNVLDIPTNTTNNLTSLCQKSFGNNIGVLPFETKFLEGDDGFVTPGSSWYLDHILDTDGSSFDVERINQLVGELKETRKNFSLIMNQMNLYLVQDRIGDPTFLSTSTSIQDPAKYIQRIVDYMLDRNGNTINAVKNDPLTMIYTLANQNSTLKSMLFLLAINQMSRSYDPQSRFPASNITADNTPFTDELINQISTLLIRITKQTIPTGRSGEIIVTSKVIKNSLRKGTLLTTIMKGLMLGTYHEFKKNEAFTSSNRTMYSGHYDTIIMMVLFDIFVSTFALYSNSSTRGRSIQLTKTISVDAFVITQKNVNFADSKNSLITKCQREATMIQKIMWLMLETMQKTQDSMSSLSNFLVDSKSIRNLAFLSKTINDPQQLNLLLSEHQIMMLGSSVQDLIDKQASGVFNDSVINDANEQVKILDDVSLNPAFTRVFHEVLKQPDYSTKKALNKKIISVGLPLDFCRRFTQAGRIATKQANSIKTKENDVIKLLVYKIDSLNEDIVFKPQKFLFELSRFPIRNWKKYSSPRVGSTLSSILQHVPTRDFESSFKIPVTMFDQAFNSNNYDFLKSDEKLEIGRNHTLSLIVEIYLRLLTGISIGEHNFVINTEEDESVLNLLEDEFINNVITSNIKNIVENKTSSGRIVNSTNIQNNVSQFGKLPTRNSSANASISSTVQTSLSSLKKKDLSNVVQTVKSVSTLSKIKTTISDGTLLTKELVRPRQFDRVFNIILDPDDFEIDYQKTIKSEHGKSVFQQLIKRGDVFSTIPTKGTEQIFKFRDKDVTQGSSTLDRYFVAIATFDEKL